MPLVWKQSLSEIEQTIFTFFGLSAKGVHTIDFLLDLSLALVEQSADLTFPMSMAVVLEGLWFFPGLASQGGRLSAAMTYAHLSLLSDDYK